MITMEIEVSNRNCYISTNQPYRLPKIWWWSKPEKDI